MRMETFQSAVGSDITEGQSFRVDPRSMLQPPGSLMCRLGFLSRHIKQSVFFATSHSADRPRPQRAQFSGHQDLGLGLAWWPSSSGFFVLLGIQFKSFVCR
jgi:hypothetical protein